MSFLKKLAGQAAVYGISSILGRAINFLLVPFYTAIVGAEKFGVFTELYAYMGFLNVLYLFGMETAFFRFSTKEGADKEKAYNTSLLFLTVFSLTFSGLFILLSAQLADILNYPERQHYVIMLASILFIDTIVAIPYARLRLENKAKTFAKYKIIIILVTVFLNVFFLWFCKEIYEGDFLPSLRPYILWFYLPDYEVTYIVFSNLLANSLQLIFLSNYFLKLRMQFESSLLNKMLKYGYPIMIMGLAGMVNEMLDRIMLKYWLPDNFYDRFTPLEALGIYGACYKLAILMNLMIQAFRYAAEPFFFHRAKENNSPEAFATIMKYFIIACTLLYVTVGCNIDLFGLLLRQEVYREGLIVVPFLLLAYLFLGIYFNLSVWYKLTDRTYVGTIITFLGAAITIVLNLLLIPVIGYLGSAIATLICYFAMAVISYIWGQKHFHVPYNLGSAFFYIIISSLFIMLAWKIEIIEPITDRAVNIGLVFVYCFLIWILEKTKFAEDLRKG